MAQFCRAIFDVGNRVHAHFAPVCQHDLQRLQFLHALDDAGGAQGLLAAADARFAAGQFDLRALQLTGHIGCRNTQRGHAIGVEVDAHFTGHTTGAVDLAHTLDGGDFTRDHLIDEPRQFGIGHVVGADAITDDRKARGAGTRDLRLVSIGRQVGADACQGIAHIIHGSLDVVAELELDEGVGDAVTGRRVDVFDAGDAGEAVLYLAGDLGFDLRGRHPRISDRNDDRLELDVGLVLNGELGEAVKAAQHQRHEQHDDGYRVADGPGDEVHAVLPSGPGLDVIDANGVTVLKKARAFDHHALTGFDAIEYFYGVAAHDTGVYQPTLHDVFVAQHEQIAVAVLHDQRSSRYQQRIAVTGLDFAARKHAGACFAADDVRIDQRCAVTGLHRGGYRAHLGLHALAI